MSLVDFSTILVLAMHSVFWIYQLFAQYISFSMASLTLRIWLCSSRASLVVTLAAITGRETLQARPKAALDGMKT